MDSTHTSSDPGERNRAAPLSMPHRSLVRVYPGAEPLSEQMTHRMFRKTNLTWVCAGSRLQGKADTVKAQKAQPQ